jgi:hypothetical protein
VGVEAVLAEGREAEAEAEAAAQVDTVAVAQAATGYLMAAVVLMRLQVPFT